MSHYHPDDNRPLLLVAPGTGGHVFPAIAVAQKAVFKNIPVVFVTDKRGFNLAEKYKDLFCHLIVLAKISDLSFLKSFYQVCKILRGERPMFAIGFGTKDSLMPMLLCVILRIPTAIHQPDTLLGRANKVLAWCVHHVFAGYPIHLYGEKRKKKWIHTGIPVRREFFHAVPEKKKKNTDILNILIIGGSQGSAIWSDLVPAALRLLSHQNQSRVSIVHQHRSGATASLKKAYKETMCAYDLVSFIDNMPQRLRDADVVFSRAGGSTLAELMVAQVPSFLVPYPYCKDHHQEKNAAFFKQKEMAWIHAEAGLKPSMLARLIERCLRSPDDLKKMSEKIQKNAMRDATEVILEIVQKKRIQCGEDRE